MQNSVSWASLNHAHRNTLFSAQKPKDHRCYVRCCRRHRPPGWAPDHHYYRFLPLQEHHRQKQGLSWTQYQQFLLLCIAVIVGVIDDDYLVITRWPEDVAVEIAKKLSGELFIVRSINNE
jgi:hypothetical protein